MPDQFEVNFVCAKLHGAFDSVFKGHGLLPRATGIFSAMMEIMSRMDIGLTIIMVWKALRFASLDIDSLTVLSGVAE